MAACAWTQEYSVKSEREGKMPFQRIRGPNSSHLHKNSSSGGILSHRVRTQLNPAEFHGAVITKGPSDLLVLTHALVSRWMRLPSGIYVCSAWSRWVRSSGSWKATECSLVLDLYSGLSGHMIKAFWRGLTHPCPLSWLVIIIWHVCDVTKKTVTLTKNKDKKKVSKYESSTVIRLLKLKVLKRFFTASHTLKKKICWMNVI